ncbi:penicillin-binding protein 2 [Mycetocola manganoxydans]|uniref:Penicillin-binding protein 2 n=1 Tax=Mycetocola manganoxydans TaxID=699879 RepID=A0A3L6ZXA9_9MICO|nr:penicillin-binding protein 2 [Mycetocola manganoxydans]GHD40535.1 cell division protein FtsI [Mycetocola manganoxydans]
MPRLKGRRVVKHSLSTRRRVTVAILCVVVIVGAFVVRLIDIQVVRADQLVAASLEKTSGAGTLYAPRGNIVDTNGTLLAGSVTRFDVTISPVDVDDVDRIDDDGNKVTIPAADALAEVAAVTGQKAEDVQKIVADALEKDASANFAFLTRGVGYDTYQALMELKKSGTWWIYTQQTSGRTYPNGAVAGGVLGFVGSDNAGLGGLELAQDSCLTGQNGTQAFQRSKDNVALPGTTTITKEPEPGGELKLTLDADLNWYMQQLVASQVTAQQAAWGTIVVTEAKTGKIRAIAEAPSLDPNDVSATAAEERRSRVFQNRFEPGSVFKPLTAASLIDAGLATPASQVIADYRYKPKNGASIKDALPHERQQLTLAGVLQTSSNTGTSQLGEKLSAEKRYNYLDAFGFGHASGLKFPGEQKGVLHPWQEWDNQTYYTTMFGQGVDVTGIELAGAYQALANLGEKLPLQLIEGCSYPDGTVTGAPEKAKPERIVSEKAALETLGMMETVVTEGFWSESLEIPGYRVAAKSGTGEQIIDGILQDTFYSSMAGAVPADDPEYVVTVTLKDPLYKRSSAAAAPVFKEAVLQVIKKYGIPPSTTPGANYPGTY